MAFTYLLTYSFAFEPSAAETYLPQGSVHYFWFSPLVSSEQTTVTKYFRRPRDLQLNHEGNLQKQTESPTPNASQRLVWQAVCVCMCASVCQTDTEGQTERVYKSKCSRHLVWGFILVLAFTWQRVDKVV